MRIDAITSCAGSRYIKLLSRSIPLWLDTLDSLTIVTRHEDVAELMPISRAALIVGTDLFTAHGAKFNKGAALNLAYAAAEPLDWILHFDADIIPPAKWRDLAENSIKRGYLHGAGRRRDDGVTILSGRNAMPLGYFQLWHTSDPCAQRWPLFEPRYSDAGAYDLEFINLWPINKRALIPGLRLTHQGHPGRNWFGPDIGTELTTTMKLGLRMLPDHAVAELTSAIKKARPGC